MNFSRLRRDWQSEQFPFRKPSIGHQTGLYDTDDLQFLDADPCEGKQTEDDGPEFDEPVPEMGKNIFALKIFLPAKIKSGLQQRAGPSTAWQVCKGDDLRPSVWPECWTEVSYGNQ